MTNLPSFEAGSVQAMSRSFLLAFADLGVGLTVPRDTVLRKVARDDSSWERGHIDSFLERLLHRGLLLSSPQGIGLSDGEAKILGVSFDGHTRVPDMQAMSWACLLQSPQ